MGQIDQLIWGSVVLGVCALIHVGMLVVGIRILLGMEKFIEGWRPSLQIAASLSGAFGAMVFSHTIQVWLWAGVLIYMGAFQFWFDALYFALVTYTTVGYGDITLPVEFRVFGAFSGVTGILCFGISTAFLVSLIGRLLPRSLMGTHHN